MGWDVWAGCGASPDGSDTDMLGTSLMRMIKGCGTIAPYPIQERGRLCGEIFLESFMESIDTPNVYVIIQYSSCTIIDCYIIVLDRGDIASSIRRAISVCHHDKERMRPEL